MVFQASTVCLYRHGRSGAAALAEVASNITSSSFYDHELSGDKWEILLCEEQKTLNL